ncbi:endoribonuclease L-PSP [Thermus thermophilus]|uniref:Endoribonuclease L-PSP n=2 Tax=Thermus thermophilus TaxID=274 RepID=A0A1J1EPQ0_THETH|nr:Rid family detoxifying hydrolase [Thermus thermophilus]AFH39713.1 endoribonuclease L-PSP, putative [Thermus thermophilus JL-18]NHK39841.1 RidA family protein [Thermus thermophilus]BAW01657.1 endoribonuclease L-PSP [Thermus thermophilus]BBL81483.1 endoribonuclease L-PSP [Thermus thermophilus]BBL83786.1 endoribonuclease L-PSP [Thermus thermophilus]
MEAVKTDRAPAAIGPYAQAVKAGGFVFVSGQIPLAPDGSLVEGDIRVQTERVMENLKAVLEAAGSGLSRVVQTTCFLADMEDFPGFNEVYARYFAPPYPARATVAVKALPRGVRVEVACVALAE